MSPPSVQRRLSAILSADAVGYSRLMAKDEAGTLLERNTSTAAIGAQVRLFGGRVVDAVGDNLLAEFGSICDAVLCAVELQQRLGPEAGTSPGGEGMRFRVGIHLGDVIVDGDRIAGHGVNVAARIEGLAEPGGIAISGAAHDLVARQLDLAFEDLGERELKNIPEPVRVYRVRIEPASTLAGNRERTVPGFSGRPAIVVRPFENLGGKDEDKFFVDGLTDDLIARLSQGRVFPVLSRGSSFAYQDRAVDAKALSDELGARYVVEGSVRRIAKRVRITAQLVDGTTGHQLWSQRYDRDLEEVFDLQDDIATEISGAIEPELRRAEPARAKAASADNLSAWELVQRAAWHHQRRTREDGRQAAELLERANELDPQLSTAHSLLAQVLVGDFERFWTDDPRSTLAAARLHAERAVLLDGRDAMAHRALGYVFLQLGDAARALEEVDCAVELNPSLVPALQARAIVLISLGRPEEALADVEKIVRLSPNDPMTGSFAWLRSCAHFFLGDYETAANVGERALEGRSDLPQLRCILAAALAYLGRTREAREQVEMLLELLPGLTIAAARKYMQQLALPEDIVSRVADGMRLAGLR